MERNWDVIREILLKIEKQPMVKGSLTLSDFENKDPSIISYHVQIMLEAGLINGSMYGEMVDIDGFSIERMTWEGHEFLDTIRNDSVWSKVRKKFTETGISMTLDLVKTLAIKASSSILIG
ncbi:MAG: DUF2513 domain-containing protein [Desulfobacter sp.]